MDEQRTICEDGGVVALEEALHQGLHAFGVQAGRFRPVVAAKHMVVCEGVRPRSDLQYPRRWLSNVTGEFMQILSIM